MRGYPRSGTVMDTVSEFFPPGNLSGLGNVYDNVYTDEYGVYNASNNARDDTSYSDTWSWSNIFGTGTTGGDSDGTQSTTTSTTGTSQSTLDNIVSLIRAGQNVIAQQRIIDMNVDRVRRGLQPIDPRYFSPSAAVNFGMTRETQDMLLKVGLIGGAALLAMKLFKDKKGR